jgi:nucleoside-diphosphate-sugar epimerase
LDFDAAMVTATMFQSAASIVALLLTSSLVFIWLLERGLSGTPGEANKLAQKRWTTEDLREAYRKVQESPTDVAPYLFSRRGRRYVVVGGSGLVGGWIIKHLLMRGEDPAAIRILDLRAPTRPEAANNKIQFLPVDVSDPSSVTKAFDAPWNSRVAKLPLTVFHTVAYLNAAERKADFMSMYEKVNLQGTQNVLDAAKAAGASCFIATSSGSVGIWPVNFFLPPWKSNLLVAENADPKYENGGLEDFGSCYAYSKALAEKLVCDADNKKAGFRTGCLRPSHAIYGHGVTNSSSISYDYLRRGGSPT